MDKDFLKEQLDYVQARIEEIDRKIINSEPEQRGYKELVASYNKWVDRYNEILDRLEHFDDVDIEAKKLDLEETRVNSMSEIEQKKLDLEREKLSQNEEIEQDRFNLEAEKIRLDREKFAHEVESQNHKELVDIIFRSVDSGAKILVPVASLVGIIYVANLAYINDADLKLCNGRVIGGVKDLLKVITMKS